ncbi:MAG TPA: ferredoxin [Thermoplasmatales archaeon]|nr:ferredoxin [Thermoplasmatales archaeon]
MGKPKARVNPEKCLGCGGCVAICPKDAILLLTNGYASVDEEKCISCYLCVRYCPIGAIEGE